MTEKKVVMPDTTITKEMIEGMRAKLGLSLRIGATGVEGLFTNRKCDVFHARS